MLRLSDIESNALSQDAFQELYWRGMLGSRWMPAEELEKHYKKFRILEANEGLVIHAQEYSESEIPDIPTGYPDVDIPW